MSKSRLRRLKKIHGVHDEKQCPACGHWPGWHFSTRAYVDPDAPEGKYYDPEPPDKCEACGHGPFLIVIDCIKPARKRPGEPEDSAVDMSDEEAAEWHKRHGDAWLAEWFAGRVGIGSPPTGPAGRLTEFQPPGAR